VKLLDPTYIRDICDYSFGDQSGIGCLGGYMKPANINNEDFMNKYRSLVGKKEYMTLFIDNIRLYKRDGIKYTAIELSHEPSREFKDKVVKEYFKENDLLELCSSLQDMKFVIYSFFEDTPIDEFIYNKIPQNVIAIYASNAISYGGKVIPMPYGIQRKLYIGDNRHDIIMSMIPIEKTPSKLLYVNHSIGNNPDRIVINDMLSDKAWATLKTPTTHSHNDYINYLNEIKDHKFMICASGNAIGCECHRDWEVLYMRRVPIVIESDYLKVIFKGLPVLMVSDFSEINEEMLIKNDHLFQEAQKFDMSKLDIEVLYNETINNIK